ncbi:hypothetical protein RBI80_19370 [Klebsiella variicola]|nr:hypothetical protein RBI80_19370 [Klebsiella variicola]
MAIIELRGGTHLLLAAKDDPMAGALHASRVGQRPDFISEKIDLMIAGHTRADLEKYRAELMANGYSLRILPKHRCMGMITSQCWILMAMA